LIAEGFMKLTTALLAILLALPATLAAAIRPEFAELDTLPNSGTLVVPLTESGELPSVLDSTLKENLKNALDAADFKGKKDKSITLFAFGTYERVIVVGLGSEPLTAQALQDLGGTTVQKTGTDNSERVSIVWADESGQPPWPAAHIALGLQLGAYSFDKYKTTDEEDDDASPATRFVVHSTAAAAAAEHWQNNWAGVTDGVYFARDVINEPANVIYPESFVERARAAFRGVENVSIKVLDVREMERLGMGALLGVGMGSERPPRLLIINYLGGDKGAAPLAFVGKGVTFDSGGISIKPSKGMWRMKYDMSGAAAVTGTILALAKRQAPVNAVAVAAMVENMPSQRAQRPGDVRKTMSGKTVEVINTDAEGRLILADAIWYAQTQFDPAIVVDVATLTGSIEVALGSAYAGVFSRHDELADQLIAAGQVSGEEVWRMPLHKRYVKAIKSDIADVKNAVEGGNAGASTGAEFIGSFVKKDTVWAHLDIAGKAWGFKGSPTTPKGAAGWGVRLLNQLTLDYYQ
jgi:leucyl aminopeptidase